MDRQKRSLQKKTFSWFKNMIYITNSRTFCNLFSSNYSQINQCFSGIFGPTWNFVTTFVYHYLTLGLWHYNRQIISNSKQVCYDDKWQCNSMIYFAKT